MNLQIQAQNFTLSDGLREHVSGFWRRRRRRPDAPQAHSPASVLREVGSLSPTDREPMNRLCPLARFAPATALSGRCPRAN